MQSNEIKILPLEIKNIQKNKNRRLGVIKFLHIRITKSCLFHFTDNFTSNN